MRTMMLLAVVSGCATVEGSEETVSVGDFSDPVYQVERVDAVTEAGSADHAIGCPGADDVLITGGCSGTGVEVVDAYGDEAVWHCNVRADRVSEESEVRVRALCLGKR